MFCSLYIGEFMCTCTDGQGRKMVLCAFFPMLSHRDMASPLLCYKWGNTAPAWHAHFVCPSQKEKWIDVKHMQYLLLISTTGCLELASFMSEFAYCPKVFKAGISACSSSEDCAYRRCSVLLVLLPLFFLGLSSQGFFPLILFYFCVSSTKYTTPTTSLTLQPFIPLPLPALSSGQATWSEISSHPRVMSHKV